MQFLAIDIGGTTTKFGLVDNTGHLCSLGRQTTPKENRANFFSAISQIIKRFPNASGIGITLPGVINPQTGMLDACAALPFLEHQSFAEYLRHTTQLPIKLTNDSIAAALAERWQGELTNIHTGAMVVLGTGIGSALFINGKLYNNSSEPSFMIINGLTPVTRTNTAAPLSAVSTIMAMAESLHITGDDLGKRVFARLPTAPTNTMDILTAFIHGVAAVIYNMHTLLDLEKVVIGGGISAQPIIIDKLARTVNDYRCVTPLAQRTISTLPITAARFHNDANLIGAVTPFMHQ